MNELKLALLAIGILLVPAFVPGQAPPAPQHSLRRPELWETSITLQQIVARQQENQERIKSGLGEVVWREDVTGSVPSSATPLTRVIFFAFENDQSINLVMPWDEAKGRPNRGEKIDWTRVLSAHLIIGDVVQQVKTGQDGKTPEVHALLYNPAVHDNNPLVRFHPMLLADDRVRLSDLAAVAPQMAQRPQVTQFEENGQLLLRIDFQNPSTPGEAIFYIIDPARGYLAQEIGRFSGGKLHSHLKMMNRPTADGTWIPARRERTEYDASGRPVSHETWHYESLSLNEKLPPKLISIGYFHLPQSTKFHNRTGVTKHGAPTSTGVTAVPGTKGPTPGVKQQPAVKPAGQPTPAPVGIAPAPGATSSGRITIRRE